MKTRPVGARSALKGTLATLMALTAIYSTRPASTIFTELEARGISPKPTIFMRRPEPDEPDA